MSNAIWRKSSVVCRNDFLLTAEGLVQQDKSSAPCVWTVSFERTLFPRESRKHILLVLGWINVCHELGLPCCHKLLGLCSVLWSGGTDAVEHLFLIHAIAMFGWKSTSWAACLSLENGQWRNSREKQRWSLQSNFQQFTEQVMTSFFFFALMYAVRFWGVRRITNCGSCGAQPLQNPWTIGAFWNGICCCFSILYWLEFAFHSQQILQTFLETWFLWSWFPSVNKSAMCLVFWAGKNLTCISVADTSSWA